MRRICQYCGASYDGDPGSMACPGCVVDEVNAKARENYRKRQAAKRCIDCGGLIEPGTKSQRCAVCRNKNDEAVRKRCQYGRYARLTHPGDEDFAARPVVSYTIKADPDKRCIDCGAPIAGATKSPRCDTCRAARLQKQHKDSAAKYDARKREEKKANGTYQGRGKYDRQGDRPPKTGVVGVTWNKRSGKYQAICRGHRIGEFDTVEEASEALEHY